MSEEIKRDLNKELVDIQREITLLIMTANNKVPQFSPGSELGQVMNSIIQKNHLEINHIKCSLLTLSMTVEMFIASIRPEQLVSFQEKLLAAFKECLTELKQQDQINKSKPKLIVPSGNLKLTN
jgi:hypothetical protein